ncbi:MAG: D-alanyl-D-alanine carboxypeptidase/D-alanyl-D-alanine-endopeptidase [Acidobacteriaceae bacterium]|nr:D-alanyl-D-alanine carboxypeptidase/D-alanyl-D-alanine-endopeptidase [Acidobacteriaceae bacterium]
MSTSPAIIIKKFRIEGALNVFWHRQGSTELTRFIQILAWIFVAASAVPCRQAASVPPTTASIKEKIAVLLNSSPVVQHGRVGYKFVKVETGEVLAEGGSSTFFTPASNTKLYTTATALVRLGADYRFHTELRTSSAWMPGQRAINDLVLVGGGDPNLSGRTLPYLADEPEGDPLQAFKQLADQVAGEGIREIKGNILGVNTRYEGDAYPDGWTLDDSAYSYGAPVSALSLNDNTVTLILRPTQTGELAAVETCPSPSEFIVLNQVVTDDSKSSHVQFHRLPGSNEVIVSGTIGKSVDGWREDLGVNDPALFAAETIADLLRDRGITLRGEPRSAISVPVGGALLAARESAPVSEMIRVINKVSQNLHAEMLLREVALCRTGAGTLQNGLKEREAFLQEAGITREGTGVALEDGSGLARQNLTTPDSTVALLRYMWSRPEREVWLRSLPIGGLDGSLEHRFRKIAGAQRVHAKTGSLAHVNALSGYIETQKSGWLAFSIMVNGTVGQQAQVREFIDQLCSIFLGL